MWPRRTLSGVGSDDPGGSAAERAYLFGALALGLALFGVCQWVLPQEYFRRDDFIFLAEVQRPDWSWAHTFFPVDTWSYWKVRPIGVDSYFRIAWSLFGMEPFGFFQINLIVHFLMLPVAYRLARQLGLSSVIAATTALICVSRPPSIFLTFYGSGFSSISAQLVVTGMVSLYLDFVDGRAPRRRWVSLALLVVALMCHEISIFAPGVLLVLSPCRRGWRPFGTAVVRALRDAGPHIALVAGYLVVRFAWLSPLRNDGVYARHYEVAHVLKNARIQLSLLTDERWMMGATLALLVGMTLLALIHARSRAHAREGPVSIAVLGALWLLGFLAPVSLFWQAHIRFSHHVEVPAALLVGAALQLAWMSVAARLRAPFLLVLWLAAASILPWQALAQRRADERDLYTKRFLEVVEAHYAEIPQAARFVVIYGGEGQASQYKMKKFRDRSMGGTALVRSAYYDRDPVMKFHDAREAPTAELLCDTCLYLNLFGDLLVKALDPATQARSMLEPGLAAPDPATQSAAARQLARRLGMGALPTLVQACDARSEAERCRRKIWKAVAESGAADAGALAQAFTKTFANALADPLREKPRPATADDSTRPTPLRIESPRPPITSAVPQAR